MQVRKEQDLLIIGLSSEEVLDLQDGRTLGERGGATHHDAKIEVLPLCEIDPTDQIEEHRYAIDREERGRKTPLRAHLDAAGDLRVFVPGAKLTDVRITGAHIPRKEIEFFGPDEPENQF